MKLTVAVALIPFCFLAACKGDNKNASGPTGPNGQALTIATLSPGYTLTLTAHKGLEVWESSNTTTPVLSSPTSSLVTSSTGLTLTTTDGQTWAFNTQSGATDIVGTQHYFLNNATGASTEMELTGGNTSGLTYSTYGFWGETLATAPGVIADMGMFATGVQTTSSQMPSTGTATYTGTLTGAEFIHNPGTTPYLNATFNGAVALNANFASNTISGEATGLTIEPLTVAQTPPVTVGAINDVAFTNGTISGTTFSGTATVLPANTATTINLGGASGQFGGAFYGPNAAEAAGTFAISEGNATTGEIDLLGSFGATSAPLTFSGLPPGYIFTLAPNQGLDVIAAQATTPVTESILSNPTAGLQAISNGYLLTTPDGLNWSFNTTAGASDIIGTQEYRSAPGCCTTVALTLTSGAASTLTYSTYGVWNEENGTSLVSFGAFATGIPTPVAQMPTTGTATYTGTTAGAAYGLPSNPSSVQFTGAASLTANFAQNAISGSLTNLYAASFTTGATIGRMNDISLTSGIISGVGFTGVAATIPTVGAIVNSSGLTGQFGGQFYGPSAAEVAGSVALSANGANLIAAFGAHK